MKTPLFVFLCLLLAGCSVVPYVGGVGVSSITIDSPNNEFGPMLVSVGSPERPYLAGSLIPLQNWPSIRIHNSSDNAAVWSWQLCHPISPSFYIIPGTATEGSIGIRLKDINDDDIKCQASNDCAQYLRFHGVEFPLEVQPGETKEFRITLEIPGGVELPEAPWEFWLQWRNHNQGEINMKYYQIWQIYSD